MKKTKYDSYLTGNLPKGCALCVKGQKMVLFVTGLCSRGCEFCPLSKTRKNVDKIYSNEREINSFQDIIKEIKNSNAKGCSLTGGDPLLKLDRTLKLASQIKKEFGKKFHIHLYASTKLVDEENLDKLSKVVDEIRFHPDLDKSLNEESRKIILATKFWKKKNIGVEIPCFPDKIKEILVLIKAVSPHISFLNLNELESGEFSEKTMQKKYNLSQEGYTVKDSINAGKKIIKQLEKEFPKLSIHLCTARLKNWHQYRNRLKSYKIPKFTKKTNEGTIIYFFTENKNKNLLPKNKFYLDKSKNRLILNPKTVIKLIDKIQIYKVEEYPTFEREEAELEILK